MQSVGKGQALRVVDGGLKDPELQLCLPTQDDAGKLGVALASVIRETLPGLRLSQSVASESGTARLSITQESVAAAPANIVRIRSFGPLIATRLPWLDIAIVSTDTSAAANPFDKRASFVDASLVELACRYALRFGRPAVSLLSSPVASDEEMSAIERLRDKAVERYPALDISVISVSAAAASLAAGDSELDVVATTADFAAILNEVAAGLSGAAPLRTELHFTESGAAAGGVWPVADATSSPGIAALLLATIDLLGWLGNVEAATRLNDAWRRTLEFGIHTDEFILQNPCACELDASEFGAAVVERLGELPRTTLSRDDNANLSHPTRPALALVR